MISQQRAEEDQDDCINQQLDEYGCYAVIVVVIELYVDEDEQEDEQEDGEGDADVYFGGDLVCQGVKTVDKIFVGFRGVGDQRFSFLGGDQINFSSYLMDDNGLSIFQCLGECGEAFGEEDKYEEAGGDSVGNVEKLMFLTNDISQFAISSLVMEKENENYEHQ
ncbi:MAG: hypothetical protein EZS28_015088 [Streblomastix strix]|uniref:Uncharacterized protein n=1 Tax=Streblomastix strix TaxID=222440 RepID=A0A5J4W317_9EUKA|nr:MAG: hypothetical protein EZS28_015088 [Streblomastix strix]